MCSNYELLVNDVFRIIHDIFGHAMNGYGFGPIGEDKAWFTHMQMFTLVAAAALTTETRGQNCWVNFGPHMRDKNGKLKRKDNPDFILPQDRPFDDQKMNLLLSFISEKGKIQAKSVSLWDPLLFNQ